MKEINMQNCSDATRTHDFPSNETSILCWIINFLKSLSLLHFGLYMSFSLTKLSFLYLWRCRLRIEKLFLLGEWGCQVGSSWEQNKLQSSWKTHKCGGCWLLLWPSSQPSSHQMSLFLVQVHLPFLLDPFQTLKAGIAEIICKKLIDIHFKYC